MIFILENGKFSIEFNESKLFDFNIIVENKFLHTNEISIYQPSLNEYDETKLVNHIFKVIYQKKVKTLKELLSGEIFNEKEYTNINKSTKYKNCYYDLKFSIPKNTLTIIKYVDLDKFTITFSDLKNQLVIYAGDDSKEKTYFLLNTDCYFNDLLKNIKKIKLFLYNLHFNKKQRLI